jgi:preprotein translocase subunit YajC
MPQQYLFYILLAVAFVALIVLPGRQRKKLAAQAQQLQSSLTPGTPVMMTSGIHGTVSGIGDKTVDVEIAPGVVVTFERRAILSVVQPTATAADPTVEPGSAETEFPAPGDDGPGGAGAAGPAR